jgi:hypothetical protein
MLQVKVVLKSKDLKPFGDNIVTVYNDIFDLNNGLAYFPINKDVWEVISMELVNYQPIQRKKV